MSAAAAPATVDVALAVAVRSGKLLVAPRPPGSHLEGHWEFPGGKIDAGEEPETAARRELAEETGLTAAIFDPLLVAVHEYPDRSVRLHVFLVHDPDGAPSGGTQEWSWKSLDELRRLTMPAANEPILRALRWRLGSAGR